MTKKIFEFNGSADLLSRLLRESDTIDQIVNEAGGGKVRMIVEVSKPIYQVEGGLRFYEKQESLDGRYDPRAVEP